MTVTFRKYKPGEWIAKIENASHAMSRSMANFSEIVTKYPHTRDSFIEHGEILPSLLVEAEPLQDDSNNQYSPSSSKYYDLSDDNSSDSDNDNDYYEHKRCNRIVNSKSSYKKDKYDKKKYRKINCSQRKIRKISEKIHLDKMYKINNS